MQTNQLTLVIANHIFAGDRELAIPYILDVEDQININAFSHNGVITLATMALINSLRSNATFSINDQETDEQKYMVSLNPLELAFHDQVEIFSPDSNEFIQVSSVARTSKDQINKQFTTPQYIGLKQEQISQIQDLESSFIQALKQANFSDQVVLPRSLDFMDPECVDEDSYLFDTVAHVGKIAQINVSGIDLIVLLNQTSRLTCSCTSNGMNSVVLDSEFYSANSENRDWIVLAKTNPNNELIDQLHYEVNGEVYSEIYLYAQSHINTILSEVADSLDFPEIDAINPILESMKDAIFAKSRKDLATAIDHGDI